MPRTIQCLQCGVVLNLPDQAAGKRLKCPKCGTKFTLAPGDEKSPDSTYLLQSTSRPPSTSDLERRPGGANEAPSSHELDRRPGGEILPRADRDLRETFDLPLLNEVASQPSAGAGGTRTAAASRATGDALALFDEPAPAKRRPNAAEARSKARRCPTCGGVVPVGMSLCSSCGLDLETGTRISLDDDIGPPPPPPLPSLPLGIGIIGGICLLGSVIFTIATLTLWFGGAAGYQYFVPLCLFGIFASVQFLRRKSVKLLMIALTFGLAFNVFALIALPIFQANSETAPIQRKGPVIDPDEADVVIPSAVDRLDTQSLGLGIGLIVVYAGVSVYLMSPHVRRHFR